MDPNPDPRTSEQRLTDLVVVRNRCDRAKIDAQFVPLVDAAVAAYLDLWPDDVVNIRLLGSVARGEAEVGKTDIDFMALLARPAEEIERERLTEQAEALRRTHPVVGDETSEDELRFYSRVIGKDLLKCLRFLILLRGGEYEPSIEGIYRQVATYAPELSSLSEDLYRLYREPTTNREAMLYVLSQASMTLLPAVQEAW
jgi:hypothetical protein